MRQVRPGSVWPALAEEQIECVVAAPSKLIRPAGDRVKTDARDAAHLTRLLRLGEIDQSTRQVGISSAAGPVCHHAEIEVAEGKPNDPPSPAAN